MKKIVSLVITLSVMILASCSPSGKGPSNTVRDYLKAMQAGKYEKALSYFDMDQSMASEMQMLTAKMEHTLQEQGGIKSFQLVPDGEKISEDGQTASVKTTITYGNGTEDEQTHRLKLVDGNWKLDMAGK